MNPKTPGAARLWYNWGMAFCRNCGQQLAADVRFCSNCGTAVAVASAGVAAAPAPAPPVEYTIEGDNLQVLRVKLSRGQEVYAEAGKMVFKTASVEWQSRATGQTLGEKIFGVLKRKLTGESLFFTHFYTMADGEVGFAGAYPGRIQAVRLEPGRSFLAQRDAFLAAETSVGFDVALVKRIGAGLFGGEGFILERFTGPGTVFIHGGGDFIPFDLKPGDTLQIDTGCIVGFDDTVTYDVQFAGGIKTALFGGEGLFLATLQGPGKAIIQSMTLSKLRRELGVFARAGGGEHHGLPGLRDIFSSED